MVYFCARRKSMHTATYELSREKNDELHFMKTRYGDCYPHFHRHVELYFVVSGKSDVTINEKTVTLGAGGLAVSTPYDIHSYSRKEEGISYILIAGLQRSVLADRYIYLRLQQTVLH